MATAHRTAGCRVLGGHGHCDLRRREVALLARERRDAAGRLAELEQSGWRIQYTEYADARPVRLTLAYPGLELRLAISEWK